MLTLMSGVPMSGFDGHPKYRWRTFTNGLPTFHPSLKLGLPNFIVTSKLVADVNTSSLLI